MEIDTSAISYPEEMLRYYAEKERKNRMTSKEKFEKLFLSNLCDRQGYLAFYDWLIGTTFFTDPASTKYHENYEGGLVDHSLKVYNAIFDIGAALGYDITSETLALVSLLHDVCKIGCYQKSSRNYKCYDIDEVASASRYEVKTDAIGRFVWKTELTYVYNDEFPYGHGEKSVYLISKFIPLKDDEAMAIRYHMGAWGEEDKRNIGKAFELYPLAVLLHLADTSATYISGGARIG